MYLGPLLSRGWVAVQGCAMANKSSNACMTCNLHKTASQLSIVILYCIVMFSIMLQVDCILAIHLFAAVYFLVYTCTASAAAESCKKW